MQQNNEQSEDTITRIWLDHTTKTNKPIKTPSFYKAVRAAYTRSYSKGRFRICIRKYQIPSAREGNVGTTQFHASSRLKAATIG